MKDFYKEFAVKIQQLPIEIQNHRFSLEYDLDTYKKRIDNLKEKALDDLLSRNSGQLERQLIMLRMTKKKLSKTINRLPSIIQKFNNSTLTQPELEGALSYLSIKNINKPSNIELEFLVDLEEAIKINLASLSNLIDETKQKSNI